MDKNCRQEDNYQASTAPYERERNMTRCTVGAFFVNLVLRVSSVCQTAGRKVGLGRWFRLSQSGSRLETNLPIRIRSKATYFSPATKSSSVSSLQSFVIFLLDIVPGIKLSTDTTQSDCLGTGVITSMQADLLQHADVSSPVLSGLFIWSL